VKAERSVRKGWSLVFAASLAVVLALALPGCDSSETSRIGACSIRPGAPCAGNYMRGAELAGSGLFDGDFDHADLTNAVLRSSDLSGASLQGARLVRADLVDATLSYASLTGADLRKAKLANADLTAADLTGAIVTPAQLARARLCRTTMPDGTVDNPEC
jgi:uncharacterized protein YjbI with pentapeptide repeats